MRANGNNFVPPRVKFTGRKPSKKKECGIAFGKVAEVYNTAVIGPSGVSRSDTCIAVYPTGNANGSWTFLNILTSQRIPRSIWKQLPTLDLIISAMKRLNTKPLLSDIAADQVVNHFIKEEKGGNASKEVAEQQKHDCRQNN